MIARKDEPLVRHLRRGTTADALAALIEKGASALVDVLLKDRYAKGFAEANASLVRTWQYFHDAAFSHARRPVLVQAYAPRHLLAHLQQQVRVACALRLLWQELQQHPFCCA